MNDIWNALVKDTAATLDKHFDNIMEDLLQNILGREWRVRQAACAAIADLVQGRSIEKVRYTTPAKTRFWPTQSSMSDTLAKSGHSASKYSTTSRSLFVLPQQAWLGYLRLS